MTSCWGCRLPADELVPIPLPLNEPLPGQFSLFGKDLFGNARNGVHAGGPLAQRFVLPPFTVLDARQGAWQERKRAWLAQGIKSEVGRDIKSTLVPENTPDYIDGRGNNEGGSIFDPVLCELLYNWFCPRGGTIIDPFAGGSVRGIVAGLMGHKYFGIDLRAEQCDANFEQYQAICPEADLGWICGDSKVLASQLPHADFLFTCPPYGDLEVYSDKPEDLSNMSHKEFLETMQFIVTSSVARLKADRFAGIVVGDFRDGDGCYRNFVSDTITMFLRAGLRLYNEGILVTAIGSLPVRTSRLFPIGRKLGKSHQNVLVFVKGDPRKAADAIGIADVACKGPSGA